MNCPIDGTALQMADRQGIEIDYCPQCRGVWLDRGELDKIIERTSSAPTSATAATASAPVPAAPTSARRERDDDWEDDDDSPRSNERYEGDYRPQKRKRKSLLGELFDF